MIYSLRVKKNNVWLNKSLNKYLALSFIILLILSFMFNLYLEDTKKYYSNPVKNVLVIEKEKKENESYDEVILNQNQLTIELSKHGFNVISTDLVVSSSINFLESVDDTPRNSKSVFFCSNDDYFNYLLKGRTKYNLDKNLSNKANQIILLEKDREDFDDVEYIGKISGCNYNHQVILNGDYTLNSENYIFYKDLLNFYDFEESLCINTSEEIYRDLFTNGKLGYKFVYTFTEDITLDDLKLLEKIVENPDCSIKEYSTRNDTNEFLINAFERLIIVIVLTSFGITLILLYKYYQDSSNIFMINKIFYESKINNFINIILYPIFLILIQFLVPLLILTMLDLIIYLFFGYFVKLLEYYVLIYLFVLIFYILIYGLILSNKKVKER